MQAAKTLTIFRENWPGALAACAQAGRQKINIEYAHCATPPSATKRLLVSRVSAAKQALKVLNC